MSIKEDMVNELGNVKNIIKTSEFIDNSNIVTFETLENNIENFKVYLPLVGNFNAGKSSILNALLEDEELLATDIIPETAIATEIIYDSHERVEVYGFESDEVLETFDSLESLKDRNIENYGYLKVYKNLNFLEKNRDIVFIDMPGLDSNIDRHNHQILNYIQKDGISFIAVVDIDDGTVKDSTLRFIEEINAYKLDFFVLINKSDKKPSSEVEKIKRSIETQLLKYADAPFVGVVSTFDDEIEDVTKIVTLIDKEKYIKAVFIHKIVSNIQTITQNLNVRKNAMSMDTSEIDKKMEEIKEGIYQLDKSLRQEKRHIENKFSNTTTQILNEVRQALSNNIDRLLMSIETSDESFKSTVNEIVRPVIVKSINTHVEQEFSIVLDKLKSSSQDIFTDISDFIGKSQLAIGVVGELVKNTPILMQIPAIANLVKLVLSRINPVVAVLTTLVGIASTFFGKSKEQKEQEEREQMRSNIQNSTIPSIVRELEPTVHDALNRIKDEFFVEIEASINKQKDELIASLTQAKEEKEKYKDEIESKVKSFEELIEKLDSSGAIFMEYTV